MSRFTEYYSNNQDENEYTMESMKLSSRVAFLKDFIKEYTPKGGRILDVGCGDMYLAKELPEYEWTGLDARTSGNTGRAINHDIESFPYPVESGFDVVLCTEVLEHVFDPLRITKEIRRLIKPSGTYVLSTPNFDWFENFTGVFRHIVYHTERSWTKEHIHCYTRQAHEQILEKCGFKMVDYVGADAHFGTTMDRLRKVLIAYIQALTKVEHDTAQTQADKLIGDGLRDFSHTIVMIARPV